MADEKKDEIIAYKGFDKDLKCRSMQYEVGKTFTHEGAIEICNAGFHSCEYPLDVLSYYNPADSRFCVVKASREIARYDTDSKLASASLHIDAEINIHELTARAIDWVMSKVKKDIQASNTGNYSAASNTGSHSAASNTGSYSAASNTGSHSAASNTGSHSAASNTGYQSAASNTGNYSAASNTGDYSAASNTGNYSAASNTGSYSAASNTGSHSAASVSGDNSVAMATGYGSKARASAGSAIVLCSYDNKGNIKQIKSAIAGKQYKWGNIKPDTWYTLTDKGRFEEVKDAG